MVTPQRRDIRSAPNEEQLLAFSDEHRGIVLSCLEDMSKAEARGSLAPSPTMRACLLRHAIFVETLWFGEAVTGRSRSDYGLLRGSRGCVPAGT